MTRQSRFIALQTRVYIVPCHTITLTWLDAYTVHVLFTLTSQSLIRATLSITCIKLFLKVLFCLLTGVNAGLFVPHCDLDACSITGYQESGPEYLEGWSHSRDSPTLVLYKYTIFWRIFLGESKIKEQRLCCSSLGTIMLYRTNSFSFVVRIFKRESASHTLEQFCFIKGRVLPETNCCYYTESKPVTHDLLWCAHRLWLSLLSLYK